MYQWLTAILLATLLVGGCLGGQGQEPSRSSSSSSPVVSQTSPDPAPVSGEINPQIDSERGLNLTACEGSNFSFDVPASLVADDLPKNFTPGSSPKNDIELDMSICKKVAVDGVDRGPAKIMVLSTVIKRPEGAPAGTVAFDVFLFEVRSDNDFVQAWMKAKLVQPAGVNVTTTFVPSPDPAWWGDLVADAKTDAGLLYHARTFPGKALRPTDLLLRWYFGPDPKSDFWEMQHHYNASTTDGEGSLDASSQSTLARITGGLTSWAGFGAIENSEYRLIRHYSPKG